LSSATLLLWSSSGCGVTGIAGRKFSKATGSDWRAMMTAAQAGDAVVYRTLLAELTGWLRRYYLSRLPSAMVEDAVQDVLLAVHEKRHTYDPSRPFGPWLAAIARYKWIDHIRALKSDAMQPLDENIGVADHSEAVVAGSALRRLLEGLKPAQADVIRLVKIEGYSIEEASKTTGQSVSLVKVNIHRGLKRLASVLREVNDAD
jgi:RNA polymerase sigma factor (sigma-70 family)